MAVHPTDTSRRSFLRSLGSAAGIPPVALPSEAPSANPTASAAPEVTTPAPTAEATTPTPAPEDPLTDPALTDPAPTDAARTDPAPTDGEQASAEASAEAATAATVPVVNVSAADRHLLSRFSYGVTQDLLAESNATGAAAWFERQLTPNTIVDTKADAIRGWWPHLDFAPLEQWRIDQNDSNPGWIQQDNFVRWTLLRRIYTKRQVHETMAEFWSNLLYIPAPLTKAFPHRSAYDLVIRQHALGNFRDMLVAAVLHPAMLSYLDNAKSTQKEINENLGREVLELHTVGREAAFTEDEVADSARILTGYHVDILRTWAASYVEEDHAIGPVSVQGFTSTNGSRDGRQLAVEYLQHLATRPATATRVARRLAVRFVSDNPSDRLVAKLADVFLTSKTDVKTTLRALVADPEFLSSARKKVRTPSEDTVNTFRVLGADILPPTGSDSCAAKAIVFVCGAMGQKPFDWPRPDGFPDTADTWSSASRALGSWRVHKNAAQQSFPKEGIVYHPQAFWLPALPIRFDALVDHICRRLLGQPADGRLQRTASKAVEVLPDEIVMPDSRFIKYRVPELLFALLDTPQHMMR